MERKLYIGFREEGTELGTLEQFLASQNYKIICQEDNGAFRKRKEFLSQREDFGNGVLFCFYPEPFVFYWDGLLKELNINGKIVAEGLFSIQDRDNELDAKRIETIAKSVRDRYQAFLYDPQEKKFITD